MTVTATILDLDKEKETATLKGSDGDVVVIKVQDPTNLEKVKIGDTIMIPIPKRWLLQSGR